MTTSDLVYGIIGGYLILMGIIGLNLKVIWVTLTFKIKIYDFEYLYGRTFARILFVVLGGLVLIFHFVLMNSIKDAIQI